MDVFFLSGAVRFVWFVWLTWQLLIAGARWYTLGSQGFVVHTIQGLRLAILSAYVHISHTSFSSHSPVNTTGKSKLVVYHPARPHNPRGLSSQSIISEGVSIHPSANCQQTLNQGNSAFQAYHRITTKADRKKWTILEDWLLLKDYLIPFFIVKFLFTSISGCAFLVQ